MPDAIEAQVVMAVRDSLAEISPATGAATRPAKVVMGPGVQMPNPLPGPVLIVHDAEGSQAFRVLHWPPMWEHRIRFAVECWTHGPGEDGRVQALLNLTSDVRRRLLRQDRTLGGLVERLDEAEPDSTDESIEKPVGTARLEFEALVNVTEED